MLAPQPIWHPNVASDLKGVICLGALPPNTNLKEIILLGYYTLTLQETALDELDPAGVLNSAACDYYRSHPEYLPLCGEGLLETWAGVAPNQTEVGPVSAWNRAHLEAALAADRLRERQGTEAGSPRDLQDHGWALRTHPSGFISLSQTVCGHRKDQEALAVHGCWEGPVKLARHHGHLEQRFDFFISPHLGDDPILDCEAGSRDSGVPGGCGL